MKSVLKTTFFNFRKVIGFKKSQGILKPAILNRVHIAISKTTLCSFFVN